jgi:hypothetical protein
MQPIADTPEFHKFRDTYKSRLPQKDCKQHELVQLTDYDGFMMLASAPANPIQSGTPPRSLDENGTNTYLWVINEVGIPYIIDRPLATLNNQAPKHTNLTGGKAAYIGGELWFTNEKQLFLSGGSGRYPPRSAAQLTSAVKVFQSYQYGVTSLGWDYETDRAKRVYDGD